ncbi:MAG: serine/threonine protein kinase [Polyangiaceae bacterium]|nr:serine/threonine protein kinase [Polyangiaceae bacterium]
MAFEAASVPTELVAGKYQLTRLLGRGGMGSVWEGIHTSLGTRVAVKFIESEYADSPEARSRFENEARAAATLQSKHVVQVYDHGVMPDGRPYIVMEFLGGEPLDARLDRMGRLPPADTVRIMAQVAKALTKAHKAGIVHRDLKPENVFLVWDDEEQTDIAKVVDFGIAKFTTANMGVSSATRTGSVLGTPFFMSPEQARGLRSLDHRADLWALGVITYRCLVGSLPFTGEGIGDLLVKICTAPVPIPSQVAPYLPPAFDAWFARALAREPDDRFRSAHEMIDALMGALGGARAEWSPGADHAAGSGMARGVMPTPAGYSSSQGAAGSGIHQYAGYATPAGYAPGQATPGPGYLTGGGLAHAASVQTGAPFTQTPPVGVPREGRRGLLALVAAVGLLFVLVGGGGVVWFALAASGGKAANTPPLDSAVLMPVVLPPVPSIATEVVPPGSASASAAPSAEAAPPPSAETPRTPSPRPLARPVAAPARPPAAAAAPAAPPPPPATPARPPAAAPAGGTKPPGKPVTDVGY